MSAGCRPGLLWAGSKSSLAQAPTRAKILLLLRICVPSRGPARPGAGRVGEPAGPRASEYQSAGTTVNSNSPTCCERAQSPPETQ